MALILAAFRPDTKARLVEAHLLVPTVQMVFRRSLQNVTSRESYLSGDAHPAAFEGYNINPARMVSLANSIPPDAIPAEVRIRVSEDLGTEGVDFFGQGLTEQLFDTPAAVARIWRSKAGRRSMVVSAEDSRDPNGRPLELPLAPAAGRPRAGPDRAARRRRPRPHHPRLARPLPDLRGDPARSPSRVDIGVFASNGVHDSAPAILSWYFPPDETRSYETGPDGAPRIAAIDHADRPTPALRRPDALPPRRLARRLRLGRRRQPAGWTRPREGRAARTSTPPAAASSPGPADGPPRAAASPIRSPAPRRPARGRRSSPPRPSDRPAA